MYKFPEILIRVVPLGFLIFIVACDFEVDDLETLRIGQSYAEVLQQLSKQNVQDVVPVIEDSIIIRYSQIDELGKLYDSSGICLNDHKGMSINLNFDENNYLSEIYASPKMGSETFGIEINQSKKKVISLLKKALERNKKIVIANCIFGSSWVRLKEIEERDILYLQQYSVWRYHESNSYSFVTLRFADGKLANIKYHWRPYEI